MADTLLQMQKSYNDPVLNNNSILFDEVINFDGDLAYNPFNGEVGILATGLYLIDWLVAPQSAPGVTSVMFKLISSTGQEFESNLPSKTGNMCGMAVIDVETAPVTIKLVNRSNTTVYFSDAVHAKSNLRVVRIDRIASDNSRCFAMDQFTHVLEQLVDLYAGKTVMIFSTRLAAVTGTLLSLYKAPGTSSAPLMIIGDPPTAMNTTLITVLYFPDSTFDESITFLPPPNPYPQNCEMDLIKNFHDYLSEGDNIFAVSGSATEFSGTITKNEYGIIVLADEATSMYVITPYINTLEIVETEDNLMGKASKTPITIKTE